MIDTNIVQPTVTSGPTIPGYNSGHGHGSAEDAKNLWQRFGCQTIKRPSFIIKLCIAFNIKEY